MSVLGGDSVKFNTQTHLSRPLTVSCLHLLALPVPQVFLLFPNFTCTATLLIPSSQGKLWVTDAKSSPEEIMQLLGAG